MLMVLLYFIAVMLETGVGVWIFGKMFPKRKEYSKYRIAEKFVFSIVHYVTYTALKGWFGDFESNIKVFYRSLSFSSKFTICIVMNN